MTQCDDMHRPRWIGLCTCITPCQGLPAGAEPALTLPTGAHVTTEGLAEYALCAATIGDACRCQSNSEDKRCVKLLSAHDAADRMQCCAALVRPVECPRVRSCGRTRVARTYLRVAFGAPVIPSAVTQLRSCWCLVMDGRCAGVARTLSTVERDDHVRIRPKWVQQLSDVVCAARVWLWRAGCCQRAGASGCSNSRSALIAD